MSSVTSYSVESAGSNNLTTDSDCRVNDHGSASAYPASGEVWNPEIYVPNSILLMRWMANVSGHRLPPNRVPSDSSRTATGRQYGALGLLDGEASFGR